MASSSTSSTNLSSMKSSRFSTMKVFKFGSKEKEKDLKPPPLPPKDPYYLQNRSFTSLSPDSQSLPPNSPLSPQSNFQYPHRPSPSPDPNQSTMSLASSAASMKSSPPPDQRQQGQSQTQTQKKDKGLSFLKFGKRSPRSPPVKEPLVDDAEPAPPAEDDGISLPWNFQHNIHVDEGYVGLPPSWAVSLADAGFSEDEIAAIQNRRAAGTRSPGSQYLYTDRPESPASTNPYINLPTNNTGASPPGPPVLMHPKPRTTSLARKISDASMKAINKARQKSSPVPAVPSLHSTPSSVSLHSTKGGSSNNSVRIQPPRRRPPSPGDSSTHYPSSSVSVSADSHISSGSLLTGSQEQGSAGPSRMGNSPPPVSSDPTTPPRRMYHVTNVSSPAPNSPPPSYGLSLSSYIADRKEKPTTPPNASQNFAQALNSTPTNAASASSSGTQALHRPQASTDTTSSRTTAISDASKVSPSRTPLRAKRATALPPRLSLHKSSDSTDLSMWSEALLSGISSGGLMDDLPTESRLPSPHSAPASAISTARPSPPPERYASKTDKQSRIPPPSRPIPPIALTNGKRPNSEGDDAPAPQTGWAEPSNTARYSPTSPQWNEVTSPAASPLWSELEGIVGRDDLRDDEIYSAALTESYSPILPFNADADRLGITKGLNVNKARVPAGDSRQIVPHRNEDDISFLNVEDTRERTNRDSSRSSSSTLSTSTVTGLAATTIVRNVSIARRAGAYVIDKSKSPTTLEGSLEREENEIDAYDGAYLSSPVGSTFSSRQAPPSVNVESKHPPSPLSSHFGSEEESASGSTSSSSQSLDHPTPTTEAGMDSPLLYYLDGASSPDPSSAAFSPAPHHVKISNTESVQKLNVAAEGEEESDEDGDANEAGLVRRPTIVISDAPSPPPGPPTTITPGTTPLSPFQRYRGWLSEVVAPLEDFIDEAVDPRDHYLDLQEIAEGESGSVFTARLSEKNAARLRLPPLIKAKDSDDIANGRIALVAIKSVAILPSGSPKLVDLRRELGLMRGLWHENILGMDALYVDLVEDSLWIRMELMERSLADIVGLVGDGLMLQDRMIARFASDVLNALEYLQRHHIAHRDVRSDNLLLNSRGILKLTDFSNAVQVTAESPMCSDPAGVIFWQAPEIRTPPYNVLKVDVWSLGATVWEMAETEPPFSETQQFAERWPPLRQPELYSPAFHEFLRRCSEPVSSRPDPSDLIKSSFISNACGRPVIIQLLSQCMAIEKVLQDGDAANPE
ncbi:hypothetical protein BDQ12DRAFT_685120 [Crucibulum laeve]|uniref:Protein kinase domain-containing protein n=1 Tax=Crucibulum laeve TaxID=68775 RepID=A0A5C3LX31_9AGAR|nr:hypothetical protein BDQ12DRAFT_685120 [Crucibulum laeve]